MSVEPHPLHPLHVPLLEVHEVAYRLKCSHETVRRLIREGKLTAIGLTARSWRVDPADLRAFEAARKTNGEGDTYERRKAPRSTNAGDPSAHLPGTPSTRESVS